MLKKKEPGPSLFFKRRIRDQFSSDLSWGRGRGHPTPNFLDFLFTRTKKKQKHRKNKSLSNHVCDFWVSPKIADMVAQTLFFFFVFLVFFGSREAPFSLCIKKDWGRFRSLFRRLGALFLSVLRRNGPFFRPLLRRSWALFLSVLRRSGALLLSLLERIGACFLSVLRRNGTLFYLF